jgi:hypothetical protein
VNVTETVTTTEEAMNLSIQAVHRVYPEAHCVRVGTQDGKRWWVLRDQRIPCPKLADAESPVEAWAEARDNLYA